MNEENNYEEVSDSKQEGVKMMKEFNEQEELAMHVVASVKAALANGCKHYSKDGKLLETEAEILNELSINDAITVDVSERVEVTTEEEQFELLKKHVQEEVMPLFHWGSVTITHDAMHTLNHDDVQAACTRHFTGDWGMVCDHCRQENEVALREGGDLKSLYEDRNGNGFVIITHANRESTIIMLREEVKRYAH